jgi:hypothetical protein
MVTRLCLVATAVAMSGAMAPAWQTTRVHSFESPASSGALPSGFTIAALRQSGPGDWSVSKVGASGALLHAPSGHADGWSLAVAPDAPPVNLRLTGRVRLPGGSHTGGLVWHYQDARNFMAVLLDLDDGDLELFRVSDGNRIRLEDRDGLELDAQAWHTMRVVHVDGRTTVSIGGIRVLDHNARRMIARAGRVGVVAHGKTDAAFDDLRIEHANSSR